MPVINLYLVQGQQRPEQVGELVLACSRLLAEVLAAPVDRTRVFAHELAPSHVCLGGELAIDGAAAAPYFSCILLQGRPVEQRQRLMAGVTDLLVAILGVERSRVRGGINLVDPADWCIAGNPASAVRQSEILARHEPSAKA